MNRRAAVAVGRERERTVAQVMATCLLDAAPAASMLVVDDEDGAVLAQAATGASRVELWRRRAGPGVIPTPWPPETTVAAASLRLPKGREALAMTLHAALSRVEAGGTLWLYGANDEGIRSAGKTMALLCDDVFTVETRRHCRVWTGRRAGPAGRDLFLRGDLEDWCTRNIVELPGGEVEVAWFPGLFAQGRLDDATRLLADALPSFRDGARVLDFGCGAGLLSLAVSQRSPGAEIHGLDRDALAIEAFRRNLPRAALHLGLGWRALPPELRFDQVVSNPPIHQGVTRDESVVRELVDGAAGRLRARGALWIVAQRTLPFGRWLEPVFGQVEIARSNRGFRVWRAGRPRRR